MLSRLLSLLLLVPAIAFAQPSGGPYGPIDQRYVIPKSAHVYYVAPDGKVEAAGSTPEQPTTIESAIDRVVTGDAIILRGGVYRTGGLVLNQGITIQPYADERPILKGTQVAAKWEALRNHVWKTHWTTFFPAAPLAWWRRDREGMLTPLHRFNNDMVFVDGEFLQSAGWEGELNEHSYYIDYKTGSVYIGADPTSKQVEITAFDSALVRTSSDVHGKNTDHKGPIIRGITFTQYAYRALEVEGKKHFTSADEPTDEPVGLSDPSTFGKETTGTLIENVTISFCSRVAGYFRGDGLIIRNSLISDTGTEGIYVIGSSDVLLERNIIRRNNIENLTGYYASAVKIFNQTRRVTFRDNIIMDQPNSNGVWYDVGNRDGVIVNNWIEGAVDGFFFEISRGATVAGNVFIRCNKGVRVLNSADVHVYNNTFVDTAASFERNERSATADHFAWHPSTGPDVGQREGHVFVNNLLVASDTYTKPLLRFEQPKMLCDKLTRPMVKELDGNVYVRPAFSGVAAAPMIQMSPASTDTCTSPLNSLDEFRKLQPTFEANGRQLDRTPGSIFKAPLLDRYEVQQAFPEAHALPADARKFLGWTEDEAKTAGAYPVLRIPSDHAATQKKSQDRSSGVSTSKVQTGDYVLLDEGQVAGGLKLCSREGPKVDGTWHPSPEDIAAAESSLSQLSALESTEGMNGIHVKPVHYFRQYVGILIKGQRKMYLNAVSRTASGGWRSRFVAICDGGPASWGAVFDPDTRKFSDLKTNGVA